MSLVGKLKDGTPVWDRPRSHIHVQEGIQALLPVFLKKHTVGLFEGKIVRLTYKFSRVIGKTNCVKTTDADTIYMVQRQERRTISRCVRNREVEDTQHMSAVLMRVDKGFVLLTAYFGELVEPEMGDPQETEKSKRFWETHALILLGKEAE